MRYLNPHNSFLWHCRSRVIINYIGIPRPQMRLYVSIPPLLSYKELQQALVLIQCPRALILLLLLLWLLRRHAETP